MNETTKKAIDYAFDNDVSNMQSEIENAVKEKIIDALEQKRIEIAQSFMNKEDHCCDKDKLSTKQKKFMDVDDDEDIDEKDLEALRKKKKVKKEEYDLEEAKGNIKGASYEFKPMSGLQKSTAGHSYVGSTYGTNGEGKGANILKHKDGGYFASGGSGMSYQPNRGATLHDTPQAAAKAYHAKYKQTVTDGNIEEKLDVSMGAEKYIHDFVHSDNPKFKGKSKKERIQMALGAYYSAKKGKTRNEEVEELEELSKETLQSYHKKATQSAISRGKDWDKSRKINKTFWTKPELDKMDKSKSLYVKRIKGLDKSEAKLNAKKEV